MDIPAPEELGLNLSNREPASSLPDPKALGLKLSAEAPQDAQAIPPPDQLGLKLSDPTLSQMSTESPEAAKAAADYENSLNDYKTKSFEIADAADKRNAEFAATPTAQKYDEQGNPDYGETDPIGDYIVKPAANLLMSSMRGLAGAADRFASGAIGFDTGNAVHDFLNPDEIQAVREHDQATGENLATRMWHEVAPPFTVSDITRGASDPAMDFATQAFNKSVTPLVQQKANALINKAQNITKGASGPTGLMQEAAIKAAQIMTDAAPDIVAGLGSVAKFAINLGTDIVTDPALQFTIASELQDGSSKVGYIIGKDGETRAYAKGLAEATAEGKAGAVVYKPMFPYNKISDPSVVIKGQQMMDLVQTAQVKSALATPDFVRGLLRDTADPVANDILDSYKSKQALNAVEADGIRQNANQGNQLTTRESEILRAQAEFPEPRRYQAYLRGKGITLDPLEEASLLNQKDALINLQKNAAADFIKDGGYIGEFSPGDYQSGAGKEELATYDAKKLPRVQIDDQDFTLSDDRGFGRMKNETALELDRKYGANYDRAAREAGAPGPRPDAGMERSKLSTEAANREFARQYGIDEQFIADPIENTARKVQQIRDAHNDMKFIDAIKERGKTMDQWAMEKAVSQDKVEAARLGISLEDYKNVTDTINELRKTDPLVYDKAFEQARLKELAGTPYPVDYETQYKANMDLKRLDTMSPDVWNRRIKLNGVTDENLIKQMRGKYDQLWYDPGVVNQVNAIFNAQNPGKIVSGFQWVNRQLSAAMLTSPTRIVGRFASNFVQATMQGMEPAALLKETKIWLSGGDELTNAIDKTSNVYSEGQRVTREMLDNSENYKTNGEFYDILSNLAKEGKLKQNVPFWKKAAGGVSSAADNLNFLDPRFADNPIAISIRNKASGTVNFFKSALARPAYEAGAPLDDVIVEANQKMLSFDRSSPQLQAVKLVNPLVQYYIRNAENFLGMIAERPALLNAVGPQGYLYKHLQDQQGWSPDQVAFLQKLAPGHMFHPVVGTLMGGVGDVQQQQPGINRLIQKSTIELAKISPQIADTLSKAHVLFWQPQTQYSQQMMLFNNKNVSSLAGPLVKMGIIMMGYDPFTDKPIPYQGTEPGYLEKTLAAVDQATVGNFSGIMNNVVRPLTNHIMPQFMDRLKNNGLAPEEMRVAEQFFGQGLKASDIYVKTFSKLITGGLGQVDNADLSAMFIFKAMEKQQATDIQNFTQLSTNNGEKSQLDLIKKVILERHRQQMVSARVFTSWKAMVEQYGAKQLQANPFDGEEPTPEPPTAPESLIQSPFEKQLPEEDEESSNQSPSDRSPASQKKVQQEPMTNVRMVDNGPDAKRAMFLQKGKEANFPGFNPVDKQRLAYLSDMLSNPITVANVDQVETELKRNDGKVLERYAKSIGVKDADYKKFQQNILLKVERAKADAESLDRVGSKQPFAGST